MPAKELDQTKQFGQMVGQLMTHHQHIQLINMVNKTERLTVQQNNFFLQRRERLHKLQMKVKPQL